MKFLVLALFLLSCSQDQKSPEKAVQSFVEARLGNVTVKEKLMERVTGKLKETLKATSVEEFNKYADLRNVKKESFKILAKSCESAKCLVTYSIKYETFQEEKSSYLSEVEKVAEVIEVDGKWFISDVASVNTVHESKNPINVSQ